MIKPAIAEKYGKREIGDSGAHPNPVPEPGYSTWIESGTWFTAPTVDKKAYGKHAYMVGNNFERGVRDCACGCWMLSSASGGPVDPFGRCPMNPKDS